MDLRQKKTHEAIFNAFEALLEQYDYADITASLLIQQAGIGRATFYRHFVNVDAILEQQIRDALNEQLILSRDSLSALSLETWIKMMATHAFANAKQRPRLFQLGLSGNVGGIALSLFEAQILVFMTEKQSLIMDIQPTIHQTTIHQPNALHYEAAFYAGAIYGLLKFWLANGMIEDAEQMGDIFASLTKLPHK